MSVSDADRTGSMKPETGKKAVSNATRCLAV